MTKVKIICAVMIICLVSCTYASKTSCTSESKMIKNNTDWKDTDGNPIICHESGMSRFGDTFYWYGTNYEGNPTGRFGLDGSKLKNGFNVYSSKNLVDWKYEGVCLDFPETTTGWLAGGTCHRPNVIYNDKTKKYVMWFFCIGNREPEHKMYPDAMLGVATADSPIGPFTFIGQRGTGEKDGWSQDCGLFKDEDGKGYLVYDDGHFNISVDLLSDDYLSSTKKTVSVLEPLTEGSAMIKYKGKYIVGASGVCGWCTSDSYYAVASSPLGPYSKKKVMGENKTWGSQLSNFIYIKESDTVMAICDQWWFGQKEKNELNKSRYLMIPLSFDPVTEEVKMVYKEKWNPFEKQEACSK